MMSTAPKDTSIFTQLLSRTFSNRASQVVTPPSTEKQQQSLSSSSDNRNNTCSSQALSQSLDWGRREPYLRLAHVFDTNNY
ncbi:hypothetical protein OSTOST_01724 [Ostertagia ostertagi]